jgi:flagellar hook-basal body protein
MQMNFSVALSAQMSLQKRLETIANNVANASTAGFRAEEVKFESFLSYASSTPVAYATSGQSYLSRTSGEMVKTDNLLDVAVQGDAWLGVQTPAGPVYTRDGHEDDADRRVADAQRLPDARRRRLAHPARSQRRPAAHWPRRRDQPEQPRRRRHRSLQDRRQGQLEAPTTWNIPDRAATSVEFSKTGVQQVASSAPTSTW